MKKVFLSVLFCLILNCSAFRAFATGGWASVSDTNGTPYNLTGGSSGTTVTPTTAALFKTYANSSTPYVIQVSGTIDLSSLSNHSVTVNSNKTIIGIGTSPTIYGHLNISGASNVIISRLNINYDADEGSTDPWTDGITIQNSSHNIWINHCSVYNSPDGLIDVCEKSDFITISWCKFYYTADANNTAHHFANLIGSSDSDTGDRGKLHVTFHHNWWADNCVGRMPRVRFGQVHVYNNYYSCADNDYCIHPGVEAQLRVENNYFNTVDEPIDEKETDAMVYEDGDYKTGCTHIYTDIGGDTVFTPPYEHRLEFGPYIKPVVMAGAGADGTELIPPSIPTGLKATPTETSVILDWNDNPETIKGYFIYRSTTSGSGYTRLKTTVTTASTYTDKTVSYGTQYYYVVTSVSTLSSESLYSSEVSSVPRIYGDFEVNQIVDSNDLGYLSDFWLDDDCQETSYIDYDNDCMINFIELAAMAENWFTQ